MKNPNLIKLKIKIKSLAEEARIIRFEEQQAKKYGNFTLLNDLHWHRVVKVRKEARATLLAYQYLRGKTFKYCEPNCRNTKAIDWDAVERMISRYGHCGALFERNAWIKGQLIKVAA